MSKPQKVRLDVLLVERQMAESRAKAQALILAGKVVVNDERMDKPGHTVLPDVKIRLKDVTRFVSRGGIKLVEALNVFAVRVKDSVCLDVGASTGGFTDCLLQHGAKRVYAIDVGHSQLHWNLRNDKRVLAYEKINFRHMDITLIAEPIDLCVMDVSFISITKLLPKLTEIFSATAQKKQIVFLIKPQFEVSADDVGKGGIVKDPLLHALVIQKIQTALTKHHFHNLAVIPSPIQGADGNCEFLLFGEWVNDS